MTHAELAKRWFTTAWCEKNRDAIDVLMSPNAPLHGIAPEPLGCEDSKALFDRFCRLFPDIRIELTDRGALRLARPISDLP